MGMVVPYVSDEIVPMLVVELGGNADDPPEEVRGEPKVARSRLTLDIVLPQAVRPVVETTASYSLFTLCPEQIVETFVTVVHLVVELEVGEPQIHRERDSLQSAVQNSQAPLPFFLFAFQLGVSFPVCVAVGEKREEGIVHGSNLIHDVHSFGSLDQVSPSVEVLRVLSHELPVGVQNLTLIVVTLAQLWNHRTLRLLSQLMSKLGFELSQRGEFVKAELATLRLSREVICLTHQSVRLFFLCLRHHFLILLLASLLFHLHGHAGCHVHQVRSHQFSVHIHIREVTLGQVLHGGWSLLTGLLLPLAVHNCPGVSLRMGNLHVILWFILLPGSLQWSFHQLFALLRYGLLALFTLLNSSCSLISLLPPGNSSKWRLFIRCVVILRVVRVLVLSVTVGRGIYLGHPRCCLRLALLLLPFQPPCFGTFRFLLLRQLLLGPLRFALCTLLLGFLLHLLEVVVRVIVHLLLRKYFLLAFILRKWVDGTSVVSSLVGNSVVLGFVGMIWSHDDLHLLITGLNLNDLGVCVLGRCETMLP